MDHINKGQVNTSAADIYDEFFVPALFQEWTDQVANTANIKVGQHVVDVACGTGVLTRTVAERVGENGSVIGLDINEGMLAVAKRQSPHIQWKQCVAEDLPYEDNNFDAVVSQFALMFFDDRQASIREMMRVLRPGGHLAVAVWDSLDRTPGYAAMVELLLRLFGEDAANGIRAPYILGNKDELASLFSEAGVKKFEIKTLQGKARFPSIEDWVFTDIKGWVLADMIDDDQYALLLKEAKKALSSFVQDDGRVEFDAPAHIVIATKSA